MPFLMSLGIGLSVTNLRAVLEGLVNRPAEFTRTPKYRIEGSAGQWRDTKYRAASSFSFAAEVLLAGYFLAALAFAVAERYWVGVPFLLVFFNGFAYTAALSAISRRSGGQPPVELALAEP
jgi:hypothetical protein